MSKKRIETEDHKQHEDAKHVEDHDNKLLKPNTYLETEKEHKNWYNIHEMGKQRDKPRIAPREEKKVGGITKHSLRKEK